MRRIIAGLFVVAPITACLFPSVDGLGAASDASSDAPADATALDAWPFDAMTDASDAPSYLAVDDFEQGCAPYSGGYATITSSAIAHSGSHSCQVCCKDTSTYCTLDRGFEFIVPNPVIGRTYAAGAWMRVAPQTTNTNLYGAIILREGAAGNFIGQSGYTDTAISQTWTYVTTTFTVTDAGDGLATYTAADNYAIGDCYLVDDLTIAYAN